VPGAGLETGPIVSPASEDENTTVWFARGLPLASVTVAVAALVEAPLATIDVGDSCTVTDPGVWVSVACPDTWGLAVVSVAVISGVPAVVVPVSVAV
jgi:hypothetical protein